MAILTSVFENPLLTSDSDTAIARGALMAGLAGLGRTHKIEDDGGFNASPASTKVVSRIAGRHYGTTAYYDFQEGKDENSRKSVCSHPLCDSD